MLYTIIKETHIKEGTSSSVNYIAIEGGDASFNVCVNAYSTYNLTTRLDECYEVEKLFSIEMQDDNTEALENILNLAGLQMTKFLV